MKRSGIWGTEREKGSRTKAVSSCGVVWTRLTIRLTARPARIVESLSDFKMCDTPRLSCEVNMVLNVHRNRAAY